MTRQIPVTRCGQRPRVSRAAEVAEISADHLQATSEHGLLEGALAGQGSIQHRQPAAFSQQPVSQNGSMDRPALPFHHGFPTAYITLCITLYIITSYLHHVTADSSHLTPTCRPHTPTNIQPTPFCAAQFPQPQPQPQTHLRPHQPHPSFPIALNAQQFLSKWVNTMPVLC